MFPYYLFIPFSIPGDLRPRYRRLAMALLPGDDKNQDDCCEVPRNHVKAHIKPIDGHPRPTCQFSRSEEQVARASLFPKATGAYQISSSTCL